MRIEAYAKVNLTLEVFGRRSDGYHALRSVVLPVSLADTLEVEVTDDGSITSDTGYADDLCVKAARVLRSRFPARPGAAIRVTKRIPAGGGLGGGSADAAAVLRALNGLWGTGLSCEELAEVGAEVGSDVPSLVLGQGGAPVLMEGRGERVTSLQAGDLSSLHLVLANPGVSSSTKEVYAGCAVRAADSRPSPTDAMIAALASGNRPGMLAALANDLEAPAVRLHPEIADALSALRTAGALGAAMSGSGSSVFGFAKDADDAARLAAKLAAKGLRAWAAHALTPS